MAVCRNPRRRAPGISLPEIMAVLVALGVAAAVTLPNASRGLEAAKIAEFSRLVASSVRNARNRAVTTGRTYVLSIDPTQVRTMYTDDQGVLRDEQRLMVPSEAKIWDVRYSLVAPTAAMTVTHQIQFKADSSLSVDSGASLNANIYIGPPPAVDRGQRRYVVSMVATGAVRMWDSW